MPAKRRRRRARKRAANPSPKKNRRRKKRHNPVTNPGSKRRGVRVRARRRNPGKRKRHHKNWGKISAHERRVNPDKRRRRASKRRHRRNPSVPPIVMALLAMLAGGASYVVANAGSYALTQKLDPTMNTLIRNRRIAGGIAALGGLAAAFFGFPLVGVAVASGGLVTLAGTEATVEVSKLFQPKASTTTAGLGAVNQLPMGAVNQLSAGAPNVVGFGRFGRRAAVGY